MLVYLRYNGLCSEMRKSVSGNFRQFAMDKCVGVFRKILLVFGEKNDVRDAFRRLGGVRGVTVSKM